MRKKLVLTTPAKKTVATSGTQEALSASKIYCKQLIIQALLANTGLIAVGDANVDYATQRCASILAAGNTITLTDVYLNDVYVDVQTNGEGVSFTYQTPASL